MVLLNGIALADMILGPDAWYLHFLQLSPPIFSMLYIHQLIMRDFSFLYAICAPNADTLMEVEYETAMMMRNYQVVLAQPCVLHCCPFFKLHAHRPSPTTRHPLPIAHRPTLCYMPTP